MHLLLALLPLFVAESSIGFALHKYDEASSFLKQLSIFEELYKKVNYRRLPCTDNDIHYTIIPK
jgi:hypothetical protein